MRALLLIAACLVTLSTAQADDKTFIMAPGNDSCAQFIAASEGSPLGSFRTISSANVVYDEHKEQYITFALGLLSGINSTRPYAHQIKFDPAAIELSLKNYCNAHPTATFASAVMVFAGERGLVN
jgi:hypothetical protein